MAMLLLQVMSHGDHLYIERYATNYCEGCAFEASLECARGDGSIAARAEKAFGGDCIDREVVYALADVEALAGAKVEA